jgi:hypothetical protein
MTHNRSNITLKIKKHASNSMYILVRQHEVVYASGQQKSYYSMFHLENHAF